MKYKILDNDEIMRAKFNQSPFSLLVRQIEDLLELHNRLVGEGKIPVYSLMGLHNNY